MNLISALLLDISEVVRAYPTASASIMGGLAAIVVSASGFLGQRVWAKLGKMEDADAEFLKTFNVAQLENTKSHADILLRVEKGHAEMMGAVLPRLVAVETKVENVEKKLPNGELQEILAQLADVRERLMTGKL